MDIISTQYYTNRVKNVEIYVKSNIQMFGIKTN